MTIKLRIDGITEAIGTLRGIPENLQNAVIDDMAQVAYDAVEAGAGKHRGRTGLLWQSVYNKQIEGGREVGHDPSELTVDWRGGTNRALFVLLGTRPHKIRPRERKVLRWAHGNDFIFAREVNHPGYRGDDYLTAAATASVKKFREIVDKRLPQAAKE